MKYLPLLLLLSGCAAGEQSLIPTAGPGDCYIADRVVNASPMLGASAVLDGRLITRGCVEVLEALIRAKQAGVELP